MTLKLPDGTIQYKVFIQRRFKRLSIKWIRKREFLVLWLNTVLTSPHFSWIGKETMRNNAAGPEWGDASAPRGVARTP